VIRAGLFIAAALGFLLSISVGKTMIAPSLWLSGGPETLILFELRLPRAVLGLGVGAALGLSGAVLQGFLRNPLADPTVVGVSSSAALGGVAAILLGLAPFPLAMTAAGLSILVLMGLAGRSGGPLGFILAGMVLATLSGALTAFLLSIAPNPYATTEILSWLMGALTDRGWPDVVRGVPLIVAGCAVLFTCGRSLDALTLGEDAAKSLGVRLDRLKVAIALGTGLAVGASVAVTGVVGFVGLIVPHFARMVFGEKPSAILLPSAIGGGALVLLADSLVRIVPGPSELRLGVAMAIIGTPFFIAILLGLREKAA
jgi:iron complex transport system permease protein